MEQISGKTQTKIFISKSILAKSTPFKLSDLYEEFSVQSIQDRTLILDVLNELYEIGLVDSVSAENGIFKANIRL